MEDLETTQPIPVPLVTPNWLTNVVDLEALAELLGPGITLVTPSGGDPYNYTGKYWSQACYLHEFGLRRSR